MTFGAWLRSQRDREDTIGWLAREWNRTEGRPRGKVTPAKMTAALPHPSVLKALSEAWNEYKGTL